MKLAYNDRAHAYWLDGRRCKGVTTIAKLPEDSTRLDRWRQRMTAVGLALNPALIERVAAHHDDKDQLEIICEEAITAAGAHDAAGRGTAAHRITERADTGLPIIPTAMSERVVTGWRAALETAGLTVVPELVERIIVYPDLRIAGRYDRVCSTTDGRLVITDLKTGARAAQYPHPIACQLALYVHAPLMAAPFDLDADGKGQTTSFEPNADLDPTEGFIVQLDPATGEAKVFKVDIAAGWDAVVGICLPMLEWRARRDLARPVNGKEPDGLHETAAGGAAPVADRPAGDRVAGSGRDRPAAGGGAGIDPGDDPARRRLVVADGDGEAVADGGRVGGDPVGTADPGGDNRRADRNGDPVASGAAHLGEDRGSTGAANVPDGTEHATPIVEADAPPLPDGWQPGQRATHGWKRGDGLPAMRLCREWLQACIDQFTDDEKRELVEAWPAGLPTLKQSAGHDGAQLRAVHDAIKSVRIHNLPHPADFLDLSTPAVEALRRSGLLDGAEDDPTADDSVIGEHVQWIRDLSREKPHLLPKIRSQLDRAGLTKRLREDEWKFSELRRWARIVGEIERADNEKQQQADEETSL